MPFPDIDPIIFSWGPLTLRWYALAYMMGILLAWFYIAQLAKRDHLWGGRAPYTPLHADDFVLWATLGIIIGGRLGYVLFYNPSFYWDNPSAIPAVWEGGMSFHGGFLGVSVACILFSRKHAIPLLSWADVLSASAPIGLFFGRISNFINGELWGRPTEVAWGVIFPYGGPLPRHPSQLYEAALEGLLLFVIIGLAIFRFNILAVPGRAASLFLIGYGLSRFCVEYFREPDAHLGFIIGTMSMGQLLSLPIILLGLGFLWQSQRNAPHRNT